MDVSRETPGTDVGGLIARFALPAAARDQLDALLAHLEEDPLAPTTVTARRQAVEVHLADSLVALELDELGRARSIADLGSGPGFPGLCLAVALPAATVWLVESSARKCEYLARALARSGIANGEIVCRRAEEWQAGRERCDVVTARAVAPLAVVAEYAAPLLQAGGYLVAWKGGRDPEEEADAKEAARILGLQPRDPVAVRPYAGSRDRWLHRFEKTTPTPERFPRRPGMARKRPLRASSADSSRPGRTLPHERR